MTRLTSTLSLSASFDFAAGIFVIDIRDLPSLFNKNRFHSQSSAGLDLLLKV